MAKESGTIYFLSGLMIGGMIGTVMGMLMAPEDKKRAEMIKTGGDILDNSMKSFHKFQSRVLNPAFDKFSGTVKDTIHEVRTEGLDETVDDVVSKVKSKVKSVARPVRRTRSVVN